MPLLQPLQAEQQALAQQHMLPLEQCQQPVACQSHVSGQRGSMNTRRSPALLPLALQSQSPCDHQWWWPLKDSMPCFGAVPLVFPCTLALQAGIASQSQNSEARPVRDVSPLWAGEGIGQLPSHGACRSRGVMPGICSGGHCCLLLLSLIRGLSHLWRSCWCCHWLLLVQVC